ncbi:hypothetical protein STANM309S_04958 [Streptomyces tanashiensis]
MITEHPDGEIEMTGPAVIVAEGAIETEWLENAGRWTGGCCDVRLRPSPPSIRRPERVRGSIIEQAQLGVKTTLNGPSLFGVIRFTLGRRRPIHPPRLDSIKHRPGRGINAVSRPESALGRRPPDPRSRRCS